MPFQILKNTFNKIINIGVKFAPLKEHKNIKLLNVFIFFNIIFSIVAIPSDFIFLDYPIFLNNLKINLTISPLLFLALYLNHKTFLQAARILFISSLFISITLYINTPNMEHAIYVYILVPLLSLIFISNKWVNFIILAISFITCIHINDSFFEIGVIAAIFLGSYIILSYSQNLNQKKELQLSKQRDKLLSDKIKLEKQEVELRELNEFKSHFFVNLSHEIKTPLTLIKGYNSRINFNDSVIENTKKVQKVNTQVEQIQNIVDNILDLSKLDANKLLLNIDSINITEFIHKHYVNFKDAFDKKSIHFNLKLDVPKNINIKADYNLLSKCLNNLLSNALKFSSENGTVIIDVSYYKNLKISIIDNGIGIPEHDINNVFKRFYQSKNHITKSQGSGIGLSFTKSIINAHNFSLQLQSIPYKNTTFTIGIPKIAIQFIDVQKTTKYKKNQSAFIKEKTSLTIFDSTKKRVLIVEDHEEMRNYIKMVLHNYITIEAENGQKALSLIQKYDFDVIVTDYMMPNMDGLTMVNEIKKRQIKIPIIVITARKDNTGKLDMLRLGIDAYLSKPFIEEELLINVNRAINFYSKIKKNISNINEEEKIYLNNDTIEYFNTKLKTYLENNIKDRNIGVEEMANHMNLSKSAFHKKIKLMLGQTPNQIITEIRLQKAKLILEENPTIKKKDLAAEVGIHNATYFYKKLQNRFYFVNQ